MSERERIDCGQIMKGMFSAARSVVDFLIGVWLPAVVNGTRIDRGLVAPHLASWRKYTARREPPGSTGRLELSFAADDGVC